MTSPTLRDKVIAVVGGSSGIGYGVAKLALLEGAKRIIIGSSDQSKVDAAVKRLTADVASAATAAGLKLTGTLSGDVLDAHDFGSVRAFFERIGQVDHLIWTSGDPLRINFLEMDLDQNRDALDVRFWGPAIAAQSAKVTPGGSITLTIGSVCVKPRPGWALMAGITGATDALTRGLAVELAPTRVNVVSPGVVKTELWDGMDSKTREDFYDSTAKALLVKHVADADEIAQAYLFLMKCGYITGQRIEVDGGYKYL